MGGSYVPKDSRAGVPGAGETAGRQGSPAEPQPWEQAAKQGVGRRVWPLSIFPPLPSPEADYWPDPAEARGKGAWARWCRVSLWGAAEQVPWGEAAWA